MKAFWAAPLFVLGNLSGADAQIPPAPPRTAVISVETSGQGTAVKLVFLSAYTFASKSPEEVYGTVTVRGKPSRVTLTLIGEPTPLPAGGWNISEYLLRVRGEEGDEAMLSFSGDENGYTFTLPRGS